MKHKDEVERLLLEGNSFNNIRKQVGCSTGTISYHANRLGLDRRNSIDLTTLNIDWIAAQSKVDNGLTKTELSAILNISVHCIDKAISQRLLTYKPKIPKRSMLEYLIKDGPYISSFKLKNKLLKEELKEEICECCGLGTNWNNAPISLQLDHVDGDTANNELSNLRIICPNCHSQTETYAGKNKTNTNRKKKKYQ